MTVSEYLDIIGGYIRIGPVQLKDEPDGTTLMGNRITEYNRQGEVVRDEVIYNVRLSWE